MPTPEEKQPWVSITLMLVVGSGGAAFALWLVDHQTRLPYAGWFMALGMACFFVCYTWALFKYLRWRDRIRTITTVPHADTHMQGYIKASMVETIYDLVPGTMYVVQEPFTDYYGNLFQRHEQLQFVQRHFLPYDDGHTLVFDKRSIYLQGQQNEDILNSFSRYIARWE